MNTKIWIYVGAFLLSLLVTLLAEKKMIPVLMRAKLGQPILEIGPRWHKSKEGTPTMGGIFFALGQLVSLAVFGIPVLIRGGDFRIVKVFVMMLAFGLLGFADDFVKLFKKQNKGLTAKQKLVFQFAIAALFLYSMKDSLSTSLTLPFTDYRLELGMLYWAFSLIFIVLVVNAANLTDGIDGLAGGVTLVITVFFLTFAVVAHNFEMSLLCSALCGGLVGFLYYNLYPARIFMGDTGSLLLGGAVAGLVYWMDQPLVAVLVGFVYLFEALSVVLQVLSFKLTGKRVFRMAPFHHHLEMGGWKEPGIVSFACILTAVLSIIAYFGFCY